MVRERIYGGMGLIISDEIVLERILSEIKSENSNATLDDFADITGINATYLNSSQTIAVYSQYHLLDGFPSYPEKGLVIWADNNVRLDQFSDEDKKHIAVECLAKISEYTSKYDLYTVGLILYTEYN